MDTSFFGIGLPELIFIAIIALIVLGPERLPATMREIAKMWGYVRNLTRELTSQFGDELKALDDINPQKLMREMIDLCDNWLRVERIELTVFADNAPAIAVYKKYGFEIEGTGRRYALRNGEYVDAYYMARMK